LEAIEILKKNRQLWSTELQHETISIEYEFLNKNYFRILPLAMIVEIFNWLPINNFAIVPCVCKEWNVIGSSDILWKQLFHQKFLFYNPTNYDVNAIYNKETFHQRLNEPEVGDKVEVAWRGKFRIETDEVYQGLAWWIAEIVEKYTVQVDHTLLAHTVPLSSTQSDLHDRLQQFTRYKIHYPGWEERWDEWVPHSRLRWISQPNHFPLIEVGDTVELWCTGQNVPGAWLECTVKKIHEQLYCLGRILSTTNALWVPRDRIRLVKSWRQSADYLEHYSSLTSRRLSVSISSAMSAVSQRLGRMTSILRRHHHRYVAANNEMGTFLFPENYIEEEIDEPLPRIEEQPRQQQMQRNQHHHHQEQHQCVIS
jgi:hypothetical protein